MGALNPQEIFPLEVWETIFEKLGGQQVSSLNLLNCSRVCTVFENTLKPTQSQWLFKSIFPLVFPYLEQKEILACRRVCKGWCRVVNSFLEDFETHRPFSKDASNISRSFLDDDYTLERKGLRWTYLCEIKVLSEFMKDMKNSKNPFIGGFLYLSSDSSDSASDPEMNNDELRGLEAAAREDGQFLFWNKVSEFLLMFGEHVTYIILQSYTSDSINAKEFYEFLRQFLTSLPNLRGFYLEGDFSYFDEDSTDSEENCRRLRELKELLKSDSSSLPEISSLETIEIYSDGLPRCVYEKLIATINPRKLKCLKLSVDPLSVEGTMMTLNETLPSLTELHLLRIKTFEHLQNFLNNLVSVEAPLGKLELSFDPDASPINFDLVCEAISKFGQTLQMLSVLGLGSHDTLTKLPNPTLSMLKIPHIRSLELDSLTFGPGPAFLPFNFAQSLEYLKIWISRPDDDIAFSRRQGPGTEFYKGAVDGELCYSPIWNKMPKLKCIKVCRSQGNIDKVITCTREMHERGVRCVPLSMDEFDSSSESD